MPEAIRLGWEAYSKYSDSSSDETLSVRSGSHFNTGLSAPEAMAVDQAMGLVSRLAGLDLDNRAERLWRTRSIRLRGRFRRW